MKVVRSFVAIECPGKIKEEIQNLQQELKMAIQASNGPINKISWVRPEGFHLTLKFLGNLPENHLSEILETIRRITESFSSFTVSMGGVGVFPNIKAPRVIWVGAKSLDDHLVRLQEEIEQALDLLGIPSEGRAFHPHLTLGRVKSDKVKFDFRSIWEVIAKWQVQNQERECGQFGAKEVLLMKSDLQASGAVYTPLAKFKLAVQSEASQSEPLA